MSTFGGLNIASSGLNAAQMALEVTGQNVANASTAGYVRRTVSQSENVSQQVSFTSPTDSGQGVTVTGISRMNDAMADAQANSTAATSSYWSTSSGAISTVETSLNEPSTSGLGEAMTTFFSAWQAMANSTGTTSSSSAASAATALISAGTAVASTISSGYQAVANAWSSTRSSAAIDVTTVNSTAQTVAGLNQSILSLSSSGSDVTGLEDQRDAAVATLASLTGATTRTNANGTVDVLLGGSSLVSGTTARSLTLAGATDISGASSAPVTLSWSTGGSVSLSSGQLGAEVASLAGANNGTGGVYAEAAQTYDTVAKNLADAVNYLHEQGTTATGAAGGAFFSYSSTAPAATTLAVVPTDANGIAAADGTKGALDNTIADQIAQLAGATTVSTSATTTVAAPASTWTSYVSQVGSQSASAAARSTAASSTPQSPPITTGRSPSAMPSSVSRRRSRTMATEE
ncbi:flagellar hook-associated protein FlgK [Jatrophihabitans endophyticus]|uniref:flagellar hook-associated protein FlgK n=1 Tax=Jatrophihabitans endophyticus TaxID=1206085 RepID=UPI0019F6738D|nr:flagellar hook-associated protein FlgK [Jatrophihabitans endophyticus]MBE7190831.1 flagellar hook-associated protein FlgK [Jatrophihabitans endophyticus]